jgi:hypothetical protein
LQIAVNDFILQVSDTPTDSVGSVACHLAQHIDRLIGVNAGPELDLIHSRQ